MMNRKVARCIIVLLASVLGMMAPCFAEYDIEALKKEFESSPMGMLPKIDAALVEAKRANQRNDILELLKLKSTIAYKAGNQVEYLSISEQGLSFVNHSDNFEYWLGFSLSKAEALSQMSRWDEAEILFEKTLTRTKKDGDVEQIANVMATYALACYYNNQLNKSLALFLPAYKIMQQEELIEVRFVLGNIGLVYHATRQYEKAIEYFKKSLSYIDAQENEDDAAIIYYNIGRAYSSLYRYQDANVYFLKSLEIAKRKGITQGVAFASSQLGVMAFKQGDFEKALVYFKESDALALSLNNLRLLNLSRVHLLKTYCELERFSEAVELEKWVDQNVDVKDNLELERVVLSAKTKLYLSQKDFSQSATYFRNLEDVNEKYISEKIDRQISEMQVQFNTEIKDKENEILRQQNQLQKLNIGEQKNKVIIYSMITVLMLVVIVFLFIYLRREHIIKARFESLAMVDELTGVANRRNIMNTAKDEFIRFNRYGHSVTYCIIDLDLFKNINDQYGHDIGDKVLVAFARVVSAVIREQDKFGRVGGEEWLLVLPNTPISSMAILFERIKKQLRMVEIPDFDQPITFSMGCSEAQMNDSAVDDIIKRADEALYQAKENGRDEFVIA